MLGLDYFLDLQHQAQSEPGLLSSELLFSRSFFMGLISGILLERFGGASAEELSQKAQFFIKSVPSYVTSGLSELVLCEHVNQLIMQIDTGSGLSQQSPAPESSVPSQSQP